MQYLKFGILKISFVLCRILPLVLCAIRVVEQQATSGAPESCPIFIQAFNWTSVAIMTCAEYIFLARTCALWATNKKVVNILRTIFLVIIIGVFISTGLAPRLQSATYVVPDSSTHLTGCFNTGGSAGVIGVVPFVLMLTLELVTFCFTVFKFVQQCRSSPSGRIFASLVHHSIIYFIIALLLVVPVIVVDLVGFSQGSIFALIQEVGQAMAVTRMQVHLWAENGLPQVEIPPLVTTICFEMQAGGSEDGTQSTSSEGSRLLSVV